MEEGSCDLYGKPAGSRGEAGNTGFLFYRTNYPDSLLQGAELSKIAENVLLENEGEGIADYSVVQGDKKQGLSLCCGSTSEKFLDSLQVMTEELGISVKSISVPLEGYLRVLAEHGECKNRTAIYLLFEDSSVTSLLYRNGVYQYSTRSRIFSERGTLILERRSSGTSRVSASSIRR